MKLIDHKYDKKIVNKPWGYEHVVFRNKNILSVTLLKIHYKQRTSLHCHPRKKTGFILLNGKAEIQLGLYESTKKKYNSPNKLMIRSGLFHSIKAISKTGLIALELETPFKKNDLVRFEDYYGRELKPYEKKIKSPKKKLIFFKNSYFKKKKYHFGKTKVFLEIHKNFKKINKCSNQDIFAILDGNIIDSKKRKILSYGDIIKTGTFKKLSEQFKISGELKVIRIKK